MQTDARGSQQDSNPNSAQRRRAFRSLGLSDERAYSVVRTMRQAGKGGAFDRRRALDPSGAPELQLHRDEKDTTDTP